MADLTVLDPSYGLNFFNQMKLYTAEETIVRNMLLLLFGKPGFYPTYPKLGMYIQQYLYNFEDEWDVSTIKLKLRTQCTEFAPLVEDGDFDVVKSHLSTGEPLLLFVLPTIDMSNATIVVLGVSILENGEMQFNFVFGDNDYQII